MRVIIVMYMHIFILCKSQNKKDLQTKRFKVKDCVRTDERYVQLDATRRLDEVGVSKVGNKRTHNKKTDVDSLL